MRIRSSWCKRRGSREDGRTEGHDLRWRPLQEEQQVTSLLFSLFRVETVIRRGCCLNHCLSVYLSVCWGFLAAMQWLSQPAAERHYSKVQQGPAGASGACDFCLVLGFFFCIANQTWLHVPRDSHTTGFGYWERWAFVGLTAASHHTSHLTAAASSADHKPSICLLHAMGSQSQSAV